MNEAIPDPRFHEPHPAVQADPRTAPLRRFVIRGKGRMVVVPAEEVIWIEAERNYLRLHLRDRTHLYRGSIAAVAARLDRGRFVRVHRSAILNLDCVRELRTTADGGCAARLDNGATVRLSRTHRGDLAALLESAAPEAAGH